MGVNCRWFPAPATSYICTASESASQPVVLGCLAPPAMRSIAASSFAVWPGGYAGPSNVSRQTLKGGRRVDLSQQHHLSH
jgi:hypothetical protein